MLCLSIVKRFFTWYTSAHACGLFLTLQFGVSFKVFLKVIVKEEAKYLENSYRLLAAEEKDSVNAEAAASLYCGSLTLVLLSLELMLSSHKGLVRNFSLLFIEVDNGNNFKMNWPLMILFPIKIAALATVALLNQWTTDPIVLAIAGFAITLSFAYSRIFVTQKSLEKLVKKSSHHLESIKLSVRASLAVVTSTKPSQDTRDRTQMFQDHVRIEKILSDDTQGLIMVNHQMLIKVVNRVALKMFGYKRASKIVDQPLSVLFPGVVGGTTESAEWTGGGGDIESAVQAIEVGKAAFTNLDFLKRKVHVGIEKIGKEFPCTLSMKEKGDYFMVLTVNLAAMPSRISRQLAAMPIRRSRQFGGEELPSEDLQAEEEAPVKIIRVKSDPTLSSFGLG